MTAKVTVSSPSRSASLAGSKLTVWVAPLAWPAVKVIVLGKASRVVVGVLGGAVGGGDREGGVVFERVAGGGGQDQDQGGGRIILADGGRGLLEGDRGAVAVADRDEVIRLAAAGEQGATGERQGDGLIPFEERVAGRIEADGLGGAVALAGGEGDRLGEGFPRRSRRSRRSRWWR